MPKIPKYYVRPDGLHESILTITMPDGTKQRKAFRGHSDSEVWNKIKEYDRSKNDLPAGVLFRVASDGWWAAIEPTIAYNTGKGYKPARARADQWFGSTVLSSITAKDVERRIKDFSSSHAGKTVTTQLQVIRQIFQFAEVQGYITYNPANAVHVPRGLEKTYRMPPNKDEIDRIKSSVDLPFGLFAYLIYYTGCRRGEAVALTWDDFDFEKKLIRICRSVYYVNNTPHLKSPKTEKGVRSVPLLPPLLSAISDKIGKGYVFSLDGGKTPLSHYNVIKLYHSYQSVSGVVVNPHQIRHGYATALHDAGIDAKTAQTLLGHAQISTTMDIYTHVCEDSLSAVAKQLENM